MKKSIAYILYKPTKEIIPLREYPIYAKEVSKPHQEGYENSNYENSHGEKDTEYVKDK